MNVFCLILYRILHENQAFFWGFILSYVAPVFPVGRAHPRVQQPESTSARAGSGAPTIVWQPGEADHCAHHDGEILAQPDHVALKDAEGVAVGRGEMTWGIGSR